MKKGIKDSQMVVDERGVLAEICSIDQKRDPVMAEPGTDVQTDLSQTSHEVGGICTIPAFFCHPIGVIVTMRVVPHFWLPRTRRKP
jgi:hypothetical protein